MQPEMRIISNLDLDFTSFMKGCVEILLDVFLQNRSHNNDSCLILVFNSYLSKLLLACPQRHLLESAVSGSCNMLIFRRSSHGRLLGILLGYLQKTSLADVSSAREIITVLVDQVHLNKSVR